MTSDESVPAWWRDLAKEREKDRDEARAEVERLRATLLVIDEEAHHAAFIPDCDNIGDYCAAHDLYAEQEDLCPRGMLKKIALLASNALHGGEKP